jgi:hypothetical protein
MREAASGRGRAANLHATVAAAPTQRTAAARRQPLTNSRTAACSTRPTHRAGCYRYAPRRRSSVGQARLESAHYVQGIRPGAYDQHVERYIQVSLLPCLASLRWPPSSFPFGSIQWYSMSSGAMDWNIVASERMVHYGINPLTLRCTGTPGCTESDHAGNGLLHTCGDRNVLLLLSRARLRSAEKIDLMASAQSHRARQRARSLAPPVDTRVRRFDTSVKIGECIYPPVHYPAVSASRDCGTRIYTLGTMEAMSVASG